MRTIFLNKVNELNKVSKLTSLKDELLLNVDKLTKLELIELNTLINNKIALIREESKKIKKLSKLEKIDKAINKANDKNANSWDKLGGASAQTTLDMFNLGRISKVFTSSNLLTENQKSLLTFENIKIYVNSQAKLRDKKLFNVNDIKLICNAIIKSKDSQTKIALKVSKQGGEIKQNLKVQ